MSMMGGQTVVSRLFDNDLLKWMSFLKFESVFSNSQYHSKRITFRKKKKKTTCEN